MTEHRSKPLLPKRAFALRVLRGLTLALGIIGLSLAPGIVGYQFCEGLSWLDSLLNASMILTGMGPVNELHTVAGKLFASFYALFTGFVFITSVAILLARWSIVSFTSSIWNSSIRRKAGTTGVERAGLGSLFKALPTTGYLLGEITGCDRFKVGSLCSIDGRKSRLDGR